MSSCATSEDLYREDEFKISIIYFPDKSCTISIDGEEIEPNTQAEYGYGGIESTGYWNCVKSDNNGTRALVRILDKDIEEELYQGDVVTDGMRINLGGEWLSKYRIWYRPLLLSSFGMDVYRYQFSYFKDGAYTAELIGTARRYTRLS